MVVLHIAPEDSHLALQLLMGGFQHIGLDPEGFQLPILLPQGGCAPIPVQDGSGGRAALTEHNPQIRGAARGQAHLIHIDPVAEEILPAEFSVKVIADLARDGAVGAQSGRGHHAGGHLAAALPADAVEQAALIAFGNLVEIHGEVHAGSVQTEKIVFHRLPPGFTA